MDTDTKNFDANCANCREWDSEFVVIREIRVKGFQFGRSKFRRGAKFEGAGLVRARLGVRGQAQRDTALGGA